jgi:hypothetical protein
VDRTRLLDAGEIPDRPGAGLLVHPLRVPLLADLDRAIHKDLDERVVLVLGKLPRPLPIRAIGGDKGGEADDAGIAEQLCHLGDPADILGANLKGLYSVWITRWVSLVDEGEIIMVWDGARCGHAGKVPESGALGSTLGIISPILIHPDYILRFLNIHRRRLLRRCLCGFFAPALSALRHPHYHQHK